MAHVEMIKKLVKTIRQSLSTTIAANFQSLTISASSSSLRIRSVPALGLLGVLAAASAARADEPARPPGVKSVAAPSPVGGDVVYLKDGGVVRGSLVEAVGERPVRILLATGEILEIDRAYIDRVVPAGSPVQPQPAPSGPTVRLHVDAPREMELYGRPSDVADWIPMCTGTCDKAVPAGWEYQVRGDGVKSSAPFLVRGDGTGATTVHVDPAVKSSFMTGIVIAGVGGLATITGLVVTLIGARGSYDQTVNGQTTTHYVGPEVLPIGIGILGAGAAAGLVGTLIAVENASTKVNEGAPRQEPASSRPAPPVGRVVDPVRLPDVATATLVDIRF